MNQVLKIMEDKILIGTEGGGILEIRRDDIDFEPKVGDKVNVFKNDNMVVVTKCDEPVPQVKAEPQGININITNENASNNSGPVPGVVTGKVVHKVAYILLAIFLGSFGIHKFYAGRNGMGVLYLLFCWSGVPGLIGIIEGIVACFKTSDVNGNIVI